MVNHSIEAWHHREGGGVQPEGTPDSIYPIMVTINNKDLPMAFFSAYFSWLSVHREAIEASHNYRLVNETIFQMRDLSEAARARFLLVYVPSKEHVYLPYLNDADLLARIFTDVPAIELDEAGSLQFTGKRATLELTRQYMDDQANLLADFSAERGILYLNLTSTFQEQAGAGAELYYPLDTHWNQAGHDLAAQTIAQYLEDLLTVTANEQTGP